MLELEENLKVLDSLKLRINEIKDSMNIEKLVEEEKALEEESTKDNFWENAEHSSTVFSRMKKIQKKISEFNELNSELQNLIELNNLLESEFDSDLLKELDRSTLKLEKDIERLEIQTLFTGKYDLIMQL